MNEIERAIERLTELRDFLFIPESIQDFDLAIRILRSELTRQENAPLMCDGCRRDYVRGLHPLAVNDMCQCCTRLPQRSDRYEPKGEEA